MKWCEYSLWFRTALSRSCIVAGFIKHITFASVSKFILLCHSYILAIHVFRISKIHQLSFRMLLLGIMDCIHKNTFSLQITNQVNNLECYITLVWKRLPMTNTQTYWSNSQVTKKKKYCEVLWIWHKKLYSQHFNFFLNYKWAQ
jgi:hypothetical protein